MVCRGRTSITTSKVAFAWQRIWFAACSQVPMIFPGVLTRWHIVVRCLPPPNPQSRYDQPACIFSPESTSFGSVPPAIEPLKHSNRLYPEAFSFISCKAFRGGFKEKSQQGTMIIHILFSLCGLIIYRFIIYPAYQSPLAKIPSAHTLAPLTPLWIHWRRF